MFWTARTKEDRTMSQTITKGMKVAANAAMAHIVDAEDAIGRFMQECEKAGHTTFGRDDVARATKLFLASQDKYNVPTRLKDPVTDKWIVNPIWKNVYNAFDGILKPRAAQKRAKRAEDKAPATPKVKAVNVVSRVKSKAEARAIIKALEERFGL